jgi:hypothetical protein
MYRIVRWPLVLALALLATAYDTEVPAGDDPLMPANGTYIINAPMDVRYVHALLEQVVVSSHDVHFNVLYDNHGQLQYDVDCAALQLPGHGAPLPFVTFANGTTLNSLTSFCGQHPQAKVAIGPRQKVRMSADFPRDRRFGMRFRFTWYYGAYAKDVCLGQSPPSLVNMPSGHHTATRTSASARRWAGASPRVL